MQGQRVRVASFGKLLVIAAAKKSVTFHLGMTGQFQLSPVVPLHQRHHFMTLEWQGTRCHFLDFRRFARCRPEKVLPLGALGGFHPGKGFFVAPPAQLRTALVTQLRGYSTMPRISWLLRHGRQTGVGNYMANEALGRLGLSPFHPCESESEALELLKACQVVARRSFNRGGTSFGIGYFRLDGTAGRFTEELQYYRHPAVPRVMFRNRPVYSHFIHRTHRRQSLRAH